MDEILPIDIPFSTLETSFNPMTPMTPMNTLFCEICMETTNDFTELYCHHKLCSKCLVKIYFSELEFCCPFCRIKIESKLNKLEEIIQFAKYMKSMKLFFLNNEKNIITNDQNELILRIFIILRYAILYKSIKDAYIQSTSFLIEKCKNFKVLKVFSIKKSAIVSVGFIFARICRRKFFI